MILRDGLLGANDYPEGMPVMQPPPKPVVDEATPEQMTAFRVWLREQGFVTRDWEQGQAPVKAKPVVKPEPIPKPAADYKALASGEKADEPEEQDCPF